MATVKELEAQLEQAQADIKMLSSLAADRASDRSHGIARALEGTLDQLSDEARAVFDAARAEGAKVQDRAVDEIRKNPVGSVALGFAAGALLTLLLRR